MIAGLDDGRFCLGVRVHPAPHELDGVRPNVLVRIVEHHGDRSRKHCCRIRPTRIVLAAIAGECMAGLEPNTRVGVVEHPRERRQAVTIGEMIHRSRRQTTDIAIGRVQPAAHTLERIRAAEHEVPERSLRPDWISEQSDPAAVVVMIRERGHDKVSRSDRSRWERVR